MSRERVGDLLAFLVLGLLTLVCFARLAAHPDALIVDGEHTSIDYAQSSENRSVGNDLTFLFLPNYLKISGQLAKTGHLPLWDTSGFAGRPMVGNPQTGLFYPPVWLAWLGHSPAALGWLTVGHLVWAGFGTYVLARSCGMGRFAATIAGGCFEAAPFVLAHTLEGHYPHIWAVCWYPWAFWGYRETRLRCTRGMVVLPLTLAMAFLTGHPQEWYYLAFTLSVWAVGDAVLSFWAGRRTEAARSLAWFVGLAGLSLGLVAVELLPAMKAQGWTIRSGGLSLGQVSKYNPHSVNLVQLLSPNALGGPSDYFGHENYWEALFSIGLVPLILALIAVARHEDRKLVYGWAALVSVASVFAAGRRLGLFMLLYSHVPGMNLFRVPSRSLFLASLATSILAGLGIETLLRLGSSIEDWRALERRFRQVVVLVMALLLLCEGFCWGLDAFEASAPPRRAVTPTASAKVKKGKTTVTEPEDQLAEAKKVEPYRGLLAASRVVHDGVFWGASLGTAALLALGCVRGGNRRGAAWAIGLLAMAELATNGYSLIRIAPAAQFLASDPVSEAMAAASPGPLGSFRVRTRDQLYDDLRATVHQFEKININDWFQVHHAAELYQQLYPVFDRVTEPSSTDAMGEELRRFGRKIRQQVLDRLCVAMLVSDHPQPENAWDFVRRGRWDAEPYVVYRNASALPRAFVVPRAFSTKGIAARELGLFRLIDPHDAVLMELDPLGSGRRRQPFTEAETVETSDPDRLVIRVTTEAPGLLVVADTWMPGWTARLNGRRVPILKGNHAQRVVPLAHAGRHELELRYWPPGLTRGIVVTGLSLGSWVGLIGFGIFRRVRGTQPALRGEHTASASFYPPPHVACDSDPAFKPTRGASSATTRA